MRELTKKERFNDKVLSRFNLYNSIFSTLPYESIANTGVMLPLFEAICVKGYNNNKNPSEIVEEFFDIYMTDSNNCLLYTSDAADDTPCVDLGGRRIIKKKK